ncbi:MAG: GDSL-type esterase/lipase family protein [Pseudonocardiales bacterium]
MRALVGASVLAASGLVAAVPAAAAQPVHVGTGYLALGDSVAFGYRPPQVTPPAAYLDAANFVGYPEDLAGLDSLRLTNASCPGETTASMITPGAQSNGCENSVGSPFGYRSLFPLHVSYSGTQLAFAVDYLRSHPHTRLVTIDIGANDLFVCQEVTADQCTGADFQATLAQISQNLATIFAALRHQGHYHHDLVLLTYYSLSYTDPTQLAGTDALNAALTGPAKQFGGIVADGFTAFEHASAAAGGDPCDAGLLVALPGGGCNIHPSAYGHLILANAIAQAIAHRRG